LEVSLCEFEGGVFTREWHWLVNPGRKISYFATKKHGIRDRDVERAPTFIEISGEIAEVLNGRTCVAHDATCDLLMLGEGDVKLLDVPSLILCTYRMAKKRHPSRSAGQSWRC